jgi:hypothetical protein
MAHLIEERHVEERHFEERHVYQVIVIDDSNSKEYMSRFGIYDTLEEAKFAAEYTFFEETNGSMICGPSEVYIEKILVGFMPDKHQRQGIKVCYVDSNDQWQWYKNYIE